jgi:hypothetical protein
MKFLISIYGNDDTWGSLPPEQMADIISRTDAHNASLVATGELLGAYGVAEPVNAKQVRNTDAGRVVTDGPYIETKEYLGSFYVVDCDGLDRAIEIAAEMPAADLTEVEIRPLMHGGTADEL